MDKHEIKAFSSVPEGYYRVLSGPIQPEDLCWSVMRQEWALFGDGSTWRVPATQAEDAYCVVRKKHNHIEHNLKMVSGGQPVRQYKINRGKPQASLFGEEQL